MTSQAGPVLARQPAFTAEPVGALEICIRPAAKGAHAKGVHANGLHAGDAYLITAIAASKCLSGSCQRFLRSTLKARVRGGAIRLTGDLIHRKPSGPAMCTRDCSGARRISLPAIRLKPATYMITHEGKTYGAISVNPNMQTACVTGR